MEEKLKKVKELLKKYNQEHLLSAYDEFDDIQKESLLDQILDIDFEQMEKLYQKTQRPIEMGEVKVEPISYKDKYKMPEEEFEKYKKIGEEEIKNGKLAAVTMAGGQGTRLGHSGPKGTFMLGIDPDKSLFQILCESLKLANEKYGVIVPWYIMTSKENNKETTDFFEKNNYFGYPKEKIKFFIQGGLPMIGTDGKVLLTEEGFIKQAADGHGGIFEAMFKGNVINDMKKNNIEWIFIGGVDNVLAKMVDPVLIGFAKDKNMLAAGKSLVKAGPKEKVGVFCKKDGKPSVIEYSEITDEMAEARDENGELVYGESHILCNLFNINCLEEIGRNKLPYHAAFKKATYRNEKGEIVKPTEPNAYKFEAFIFDALEKLDDMAILRVKREEEFAPVKNATGVDSPETARKLYNDFMNR